MRSRPRPLSGPTSEFGEAGGDHLGGPPPSDASSRPEATREGGWGRFRWWIGAVLLIAVVAFGASRANRDSKLPDFAPSGDAVAVPSAGELPAVTLDEFEGMLVGLQGQPVVVNIWASWCAPCRTEMPMLQDAAEAFAGKATVLGVASNDDPRAARAFLDEVGVTYPNVFDPSGEIRVALGLTAYPTTYVFGADGSIRARVDGGISEQRLAGLIEAAT
ncbi:MAG: TlpA disulfide reductase family protein [Ilumatobacter fluminis]|uniref:TlpA family protein disulfide reductase n=1 Tax=Ilumatobacter fluminis TaxID=467091 RepID=UPI0032ED06F4